MIVTPDFDAETHAYSYRGARILSVTQILHLSGMVDHRWYKAGCAELGSALHEALHFDDQNDLAEDSIDPRIMGRVRAWRKFREQMQPQFTDIEVRLAKIGSPSFAGTFDRVAIINGQQWLLDIKGGQPQPWHCDQLNAYGLLKPGNRLGNVYLRENEKYLLIERELSAVRQEEFLSMARVANRKFEMQKGDEHECVPADVF